VTSRNGGGSMICCGIVWGNLLHNLLRRLMSCSSELPAWPIDGNQHERCSQLPDRLLDKFTPDEILAVDWYVDGKGIAMFTNALRSYSSKQDLTDLTIKEPIRDPLSIARH
jgi:hypothetical protein